MKPVPLMRLAAHARTLSTAMSPRPRPTYLLLDLNGTLHVGDEPTRGAVRALQRLREVAERRSGGEGDAARIGIRFCSNSSKESTSSLVARLRSMGFHHGAIPSSSVFTSLDACAALCHRSSYASPLLLLSPSAQSAFDAERFPRAVRPSGSPDEGAALPDVRHCDAVVLGLAPQLMRHAWLDEAFRLLSGEYGARAPLVGTHRAMYLRPSAAAPLSLGPGAFIAALEAAAGVDPARSTHIVGKPQPAFFKQCLEEMGWEEGSEADVWIVGDDAVQDLSIPLGGEGGEGNAKAEEMGLRSVRFRRALVKTGKYREGDEAKVRPDRIGEGPPVQVWDDFAQWVEAFIEEQGQAEVRA